MKFRIDSNLKEILLSLLILSIIVVCCETNSTREVDNNFTTVNVDTFVENISEVPKQTIPDSLRAPCKIGRLGARNGSWVIFYNSLKEETNYENARTYRKINYENGKPKGVVRDFKIDGTPVWSGELFSDFPYDIFNGKSFFYDDAGNLESEKEYKNGVLNGVSIEYYKNKKLKSKCTYSNNNYDGIFIQYYENGNVEFKTKFSNGIQNGRYVEYYQNGRKYQEGRYFNDEKIGSWKYFDEDGDYRLTDFVYVRVGAICNDGTRSYSTGRGTCSHHGGVNYWLTDLEEVDIGGTGKYSSNYLNY